jgi:hypothetical protein
MRVERRGEGSVELLSGESVRILCRKDRDTSIISFLLGENETLLGAGCLNRASPGSVEGRPQ